MRSPTSRSPRACLRLDPDAWSLRWYRSIVEDEQWGRALVNSMIIGVCGNVARDDTRHRRGPRVLANPSHAGPAPRHGHSDFAHDHPP